MISRFSNRDQSAAAAASLPKKCGPVFFFLSFNNFRCSYSRKRSASTQSPSPDGNRVASPDAVLSKRIKTVAVGSPEVDDFPPDNVSFVISFFPFVDELIVSSASKKGQLMKSLTLRVNPSMRGFLESACTSMFCLVFNNLV